MPRESGIAGGIAPGVIHHVERGQGAPPTTMMGMQQAPAAHQYQNPTGAYGGTTA